MSVKILAKNDESLKSVLHDTALFKISKSKKTIGFLKFNFILFRVVIIIFSHSAS